MHKYLRYTLFGVLFAAALALTTLDRPISSSLALAVTQIPSTPYDDVICDPAHRWSCDAARAVMWCESEGRPWIESRGNYGLFQINRVHAPRFAPGGDPEAFLDPLLNISVAHTLYTEKGWQPWVHCGRRFR